MQVRLILAAAILAVGGATLFSAAKAGDDSMTTAHFIAYCSATPNSCRDDIGMATMTGEGGCPPSSMLKPSNEQVLQVVGWLKAHPDVHPDDSLSAVDAAISDLYPCSSN